MFAQLVMEECKMTQGDADVVVNPTGFGVLRSFWRGTVFGTTELAADITGVAQVVAFITGCEVPESSARI